MNAAAFGKTRTSHRPETEKGRVLVTGASGFLGKRVIQLLSSDGYTMRALARRPSDKLRKLHVETVLGDVRDRAGLRAAFRDVDFVVHAAADTSGKQEEGKTTTIEGTSNVLSLCREFSIRKLIYISSCNVYEIATAGKNQLITEESLLERFPERRGMYTEAKLTAERLVMEAINKADVQVVCLRPGTIFGPGGQLFFPIMGFPLGSKILVIIGNGRLILPLVYIDNLVHAIRLSIENVKSSGRVYNVVDPFRITKRDYVERVLKKLHPTTKYLYIPQLFVHSAVKLQESLFRLLKRKPFLTGYRLLSSQNSVVYDSSKLERELQWRPLTGPKEAAAAIISREERARIIDRLHALEHLSEPRYSDKSIAVIKKAQS